MEKVVITGMGVVSPIGTGLAAFEANLFAGRHGIVPLDRFDTTDMSVRVHAPVTGVDSASHVDERTARRLDAYSLFGLIAAREAMADAALTGAVDPYRLGVHMTSGMGGVGTLLDEADALLARGARRVSPLLVPKFVGNMLAGGVAIDIGARGPAVAHVAACAASAASIGEGMRAIRHGYADAIVCGGAEASTRKLIAAGFENLRALTAASDPDRASIPFDRDRAGFVIGEGGAALVLESESHARARGARIHAEVTGFGVTNDASHITAPAENGAALDRALGDALAEAGEPDRPLHVNAHGTGTVLNDRSEAASIRRVLGEGTLVTSTKSVTGHMLGAAGAVEAIAAVLALHRGEVPPTVGTSTVADDIAVDVVHTVARPAPLTRAASLSLGFGGHNIALILDKAA
ncbi:beta-ketoacyl-[acyl-carrier-protein] synthase family protein [Microbacterium sp.]|uniref:beta-ketoacyl-[acyl-carrier-protein] synthase family protein n=1 Tax=Microbacterium sp. TaxID=51671 RepID=UPI003A86DF07